MPRWMSRRVAKAFAWVALAAVAFFATEPNVRAEEAKTSAKPTVAVFKLDGPFSEAPADEGIPLFGEQAVSFRTILDRLNKAANDDNVKGVVLLSENGGVSVAQVEELRQAIGKIRAAGKDVFVHADSMGPGQYALFSGATRVSLTPNGDLWLIGLYGEQVYLRGLLDKIGVQPNYMTCGDYKSAGEMFMREGPSPEADRMTNWLFDGIYETIVGAIAEGRKLEKDKVRELIDDGPYTARRAKEAGLIDAVEQRQDFEAMLREKYGKEVVFDKRFDQPRKPTIDFSSPFGVMKFYADLLGGARKQKSDKPAVAIVYVEGPIITGTAHASPLGAFGGVAASTDIRRALDRAASDDTVKAVVLRVDSPGGSATASEIILDATKRVKAKKPFVVSMGSVAGSGGYYVSLASDTVFADESTITASIGVVTGKFVTTEMWNHLGIVFKPYHRGKNAGMLSSAAPFSADEERRMRDYMEEIYQVFRNHVTESRGDRLKKPLDELAGGRVFTGRQALELGLIDKIGTLPDAIAHVADKAELKDYEVRTIPEPKNIIEMLLSAGDPDNDAPGVNLRSAMGGSTGVSLLDLASPLLQHLDKPHLAAVKSALIRMQLLQQEGVLLTTPEFLFSN